MGCDIDTNAEYTNDGTNKNINMACKTCDSVFTKVVALNISQTNDMSLIKTDCMNKVRIPNCKVQKSSYNSDNAELNTTYQSCTECAHGYYLRATINSISVCTPRKNLDKNCSTFSVTTDLCSTCSQGTYLSTDSKTCIPFPIQNKNCVAFNDLECMKCQNTTTPVYLSQGACIAVPTANLVTNCAFYSNSSTC